MKILELSKQDIFSQTCDNCKCVFAYSPEDGMKDFKCPVCKQNLVPTWDGKGFSERSITDHENSIVSMLTCIRNLNIRDSVTLHHSNYGDIVFDVCAKDYLIPDTVTLVSQKCITKMEWNKHENVNNYSKSSIRYWLNTEFLSGFAEPLRNSIKIPDWECHDDTTPIIINDKITIPSMTEMGISYLYSQVEGNEFAYKNIEDKFTDTVDGKSTVSYCWTRTPCSSYTSAACYFNSSGSGNDYYCSNSYGVPVCFII